MPLSPKQELVWEALATELADIDAKADFRPVLLHVDFLPETPADLMHAVDVNRTNHQLSERDVERAMKFIGSLFLDGDAKATIAELPPQMTETGYAVELRFPSVGRLDARA